MKIQVLVAAAVALACGSALAGPGHEHGKEGHGMSCPMMEAANATPEERTKMRAEMFAQLDANKDGNVSRAEFDQHHDAMMKKHAEHAEHGEHAEHAEHGKHEH